MDYNTIHTALKVEGLTWHSAAEAIGCSPSNLMAIAGRKSKSRAVAKRLAILIRHDVKDVFPDVPSYSNDPDHDRNANISAARARLAEAGVHPLTTKTA